MRDNYSDIPLPIIKAGMDEFDALPLIVRRAIAHHPYRIHPTKAGMDVIQQRGEAAFIKDLAASTPRMIQEAALHTYGPDHPQAK